MVLLPLLLAFSASLILNILSKNFDLVLRITYNDVPEYFGNILPKLRSIYLHSKDQIGKAISYKRKDDDIFLETIQVSNPSQLFQENHGYRTSSPKLINENAIRSDKASKSLKDIRRKTNRDLYNRKSVPKFSTLKETGAQESKKSFFDKHIEIIDEVNDNETEIDVEESDDIIVSKLVADEIEDEKNDSLLDMQNSFEKNGDSSDVMDSNSSQLNPKNNLEPSNAEFSVVSRDICDQTSLSSASQASTSSDDRNLSLSNNTTNLSHATYKDHMLQSSGRIYLEINGFPYYFEFLLSKSPSTNAIELASQFCRSMGPKLGLYPDQPLLSLSPAKDSSWTDIEYRICIEPLTAALEKKIKEFLIVSNP